MDEKTTLFALFAVIVLMISAWAKKIAMRENPVGDLKKWWNNYTTSVQRGYKKFKDHKKTGVTK